MEQGRLGVPGPWPSPGLCTAPCPFSTLVSVDRAARMIVNLLSNTHSSSQNGVSRAFKSGLVCRSPWRSCHGAESPHPLRRGGWPRPRAGGIHPEHSSHPGPHLPSGLFLLCCGPSCPPPHGLRVGSRVPAPACPFLSLGGQRLGRQQLCESLTSLWPGSIPGPPAGWVGVTYPRASVPPLPLPPHSHLGSTHI